MNTISIRIQNQEGKVLAAEKGSNFANLVYTAAYTEGDNITVSAPEGSFLQIKLDDVLETSFVYMKQSEYTLVIPFGEKKYSYNPKTFSGELHLLSARFATEDEIACRKNLALNCHDTTSAKDICFPHVSANIETRGESVFAARNAINGNTENRSHGNWPYESWGINRDPEAELTLEFGRPVKAEKLVLVTRADFPHDNYWQQATVTFTLQDGTKEEMVLRMEKSYEPHEWQFDTPKTITRLTLGKLLKDETDPSPFPALTQIEVWGTEADR